MAPLRPFARRANRLAMRTFVVAAQRALDEFMTHEDSPPDAPRPIRGAWSMAAEGRETMDGAATDQSARIGGPRPRESVLRIKAYKGGEGGGTDRGRTLKLSANENPNGPSPRAADAYRRLSDQLGVYPDGSAAALREAIAAAHGLEPDRIVCGAGSDELIGLLCQSFAAPGEEVLHTAFGFAMYRIYALGVGAEPVAAPEAGLTADIDAILDNVTPRTRVVFLANPNNPTGTYISGSEMARLADKLPGDVVLAIDGAYEEYMREPDHTPGVAFARERPNVVTTRTFSKIHGLAALRLGWMYGPPTIVDALNRVRGPFNVTAPAIAAGAAAIQDADYVEACALQNEVWRDWLTKKLNALGFETPRSWGNFVLPAFDPEGPASAAAADAFLRARGIYARRMESYGLPNRLRITVGAPAQNAALIEAFTAFRDGEEPVASSSGLTSRA